MSRIKRSLWLLGAPWLVVAALGTPGTANAQEACGDDTCPKGFTCTTVPVGCPLIDCQSPEGCDDTCTPSERATCVPEPCSSDADCAEDMVCITREIPCTNAVPACPPDGPCPEPANLECTPNTTSQCVPRWTLPCSDDADCGEGFTCEELESCSCGGSSGVPTPLPSPESGASPANGGGTDAVPDPAFAPAPPADGERVPPEDGASDPICECVPSGEKSCRVIEQACTADADCPSGWTCADNPEGVCWSRPGGDTGCTPADPAKICFPPYANVGRDGGGGVSLDESAGPGVPGTTAGNAAPPRAPGEFGTTSRAAGCSMAPASQSGGGHALVALFGVALSASLLRRRRRA